VFQTPRSTGSEERARRGKDLWPGVVTIALAQQTRRRSIIKQWIQPLEPRLNDGRRVRLRQGPRDDEGVAKTLGCVGVRISRSLAPLINGSGLAN
jgi:hypothetical protein